MSDTTDEVPNTGIQIQDIENALTIIDYAADQGVFKGWKMMLQVYAVREKLSNFVEYAKSVAETDEKPESV